jgi:hypothetical protein
MFTFDERIAAKKMAYLAGAPHVKPVVERCQFELATNFDCPSSQILGIYGHKIGLTSPEMGRLLQDLIAPVITNSVRRMA